LGRVVARERLTDDTMSFEIEPAGGGVFPSWSPGAHIDIHVRDGVVRQYSLTGKTKVGRYLIAVQRDPQSRGGSETIHAKFESGSAVKLSRPRNHFVLDETASRYLLFSGDIGLTSLLAMACRLHELGREFTWHVSARSRSRLAWAEQIETLPFRGSIRPHFDDGGAEQALDAASEMRNAPAGILIYMCGPRGYMDYVADAALIAGIPKEQVHQERFAAEIDVNGDPFAVIAARSGRRIEVGPNETILAAVTRAGYHVETGCRNGVCGSCLTRVVEGWPDHRDMVLTDAEKAENNRIAVCCSRSKSRVIVLDI
jgi:vanillate O-demethylase ferredoxin subunit